MCADGLKRTEPVINVGILGASDDKFILDGDFMRSENSDGSTLYTPSSSGCTFTLPDVRIGIGFHWERMETQTFRGALRICSDGLVINNVPLEEYLCSVISSEMRSSAPAEFLKAHAIVSRSWLLAMLDREKEQTEALPDNCHMGGGAHTIVTENSQYDCREIIRWYDREAHTRFDVCADDHCQRYQGITKAISPEVGKAVRETRGQVLVFDGKICDARFSKCCGGITEDFQSAWEDREIPSLRSVKDCDADGRCYCDTDDTGLLQTILNDYDLDAPGFFQWETTLDQRQASYLIKNKTGIDPGDIIYLQPVSRGKSGRITRLLVKGTRNSFMIGKELEIRRILSPTHLKSSAFTIKTIMTPGSTLPERFILSGKGWGHGVGMCQIGAAVMASQGASCSDILSHYFTDTDIIRLYE